jgi:hypothetical protein
MIASEIVAKAAPDWPYAHHRLARACSQREHLSEAAVRHRSRLHARDLCRRHAADPARAPAGEGNYRARADRARKSEARRAEFLLRRSRRIEPHGDGALSLRAKIDLQHIPYKGGAQATLELVAGSVELNFGQWASSSRSSSRGQVRALGVSTPKRIAVAPEIPTIAESGLPGFESRSWYGMLGPAKMARPLLLKLHGEIARIIAGPDFGSKFANEGVVVGDMTPEQFSEFVRQEIKRYAAVVKAAKLTPG